MSADVFAQWLRRQGHHVVRTTSSYWHSQGPRVYQAFPYHWIVEPSELELRGLLQEQKAIGLRYSTPCHAPVGKISYHVTYEEEAYRLEDLPKKARYDVRKGLAGVSIEPISFSRLATDGWRLRTETLERQGRYGAESQAWWQRLCIGADDLPGFETWGVLIEGQLAASLIAFTCDDTCLILYQQSQTVFLSHGVNNALTYEFTREAVARPQIRQIFYGLHSLDAPESVDQYKFRMRYIAKPVRQRVVFHSLLKPLFGNTSYRSVRWLMDRQPQRTALPKVEGMMRFYLEGQRPLTEQSWPEALLEQKETILNQV
ncbi:MAG: hypothetical protein IPJ94_16410 [Chloroflexi bacterium]|nr:hypothetical protein [Chloroflexota bacterium]